MEKLFSLEGKVALVTGGTSGIGLMIASGFVRSGAKVYIASRKEAACKEAQTMLAEHGECIAIPADLSTEAGCVGLISEISSQETKIDILVNNAGATWGAPFEEYPDKAWDKLMGLNVKAIFNLTQKAFPLLKAAASDEHHAKVINISSVASQSTASMSAYAYGPSKAAVNQLTKILASEFARDRICVNAIAPGLFPSKMTDFFMATDEAQKVAGKQIPMGRVGSATDMAGLSIFLASPASDYITGAVIPIDGGELVKV